MHSILIQECFSLFQPPQTRSEIFQYHVETQGADVDIECLKENIVRKRYPRLPEVSSITIILRDGHEILVDQIPFSILETNPSVLVLVSNTAEEATQIQAGGGVNFPPVLCVYRSDHLKFLCRLPESTKGPNDHAWVSGQIPWSASTSDIVEHLTLIGI